MRWLCLIWILLCCGFDLEAQPSLAGKVVDRQGQAVPSVRVSCSCAGCGSQTAVSDSQGRFILTGCGAARQCFIQAEGYKKITALVHPADSSRLWILEDSSLQLAPVVIRLPAFGLREGAESVTLIDAKPYRDRAITAVELLNQAPGIHFRQQGGLGSQADVSLDGLGGKQIKYFLDGLPFEHLSRGFGIEALPVNSIDRIEVYKGWVPVALGTDALGGAIHIVTRKDPGNHLEASYTIASFHTHRLTLNGYRSLGASLYVRANAFANYSANDYSITAPVVDSLGNPHERPVTLFHNRYRGFGARVELGAVPSRFADQLAFSCAASGYGQQLQNNVFMTQAYGAATYGERGMLFSGRYDKTSLLPRLDLGISVQLSRTESRFTDTSLNAYGWDGSVLARRSYGGEISASRNRLELVGYSASAAFRAAYRIDRRTLLHTGVTLSSFRRSGTDPVAVAYYHNDYFSSPVRMRRQVSGVELERQLPAHFVSGTAVKSYGYRSTGYVLNKNLEYLEISESKQAWGWSQTLAWAHGAWRARGSYEYAARLPDEQELFGDYVLLKPNPALIPERSHNIGVSASYRSGMVSLSSHVFYRKVSHIIYLESSAFFSQYKNLLQAEIRGAELECALRPLHFLTAKINGTCQQSINRSSPEQSGTAAGRYYGLQIPNTPVFYGNAHLEARFGDIATPNDRVTLWWHGRETEPFFLYWAVDGLKETKAVIPRQFTQDAGVSYSIRSGQYTVGVEVHNLADARNYDNFNVWLPGRSFSVKLKTSFS